MAQGSFLANSTTVTFSEITPAGIPGLVTEGRYQSPPGTDGGLYISTGKAPRQFTKTVTVEGTWANDGSDKAYETLLGLVGYYDSSNLLTVHDMTQQYIILDDVQLLDELFDGTNIIAQRLQLTFTRFQ